MKLGRDLIYGQVSYPLPMNYLFIHLSGYLLIHLSIYVSIFLCIYISIYRSNYLSKYLSHYYIQFSTNPQKAFYNMMPEITIMCLRISRSFLLHRKDVKTNGQNNFTNTIQIKWPSEHFQQTDVQSRVESKCSSIKKFLIKQIGYLSRIAAK